MTKFIKTLAMIPWSWAAPFLIAFQAPLYLVFSALLCQAVGISLLIGFLAAAKYRGPWRGSLREALRATDGIGFALLVGTFHAMAGLVWSLILLIWGPPYYGSYLAPTVAAVCCGLEMVYSAYGVRYRACGPA